MNNKDQAIFKILEEPVITIDIIQHLIGDLIGEGQYRYVFDFGKDKVAKIDVGVVLANANEWLTWCDVKDFPKAAKWFAPVIRCSTGAKFLVMQRADMDRPIKDYPEEIPEFFGDVKKQNFGFIGKQFVCVDYGIHYINTNGLKNFKMRKIKWNI